MIVKAVCCGVAAVLGVGLLALCAVLAARKVVDDLF